MPFGAGGIFISFLILYGNICIDYFDSVWKHIFTTPGEGEHARHTSRKVAETPGGGSRFGRHEGRSDTVGGARGRPESSKEAR